MHSLHSYFFWFVICNILPKRTEKLKWRRLDEGYDVGDLKFANGNSKREADYRRHSHRIWNTVHKHPKGWKELHTRVVLVLQGRQVKNEGKRYGS